MSQVFGDPKRLVNDYMAASHAIGITARFGLEDFRAMGKVISQGGHTGKTGNSGVTTFPAAMMTT